MKKIPHGTILKKLIMLGATLALQLGLPFAFANRAFANPTPKFAYVANAGDYTVSAYTINSSTGALRAVTSSPFGAELQPSSVAVDPSNRFVYVASPCYHSGNCSSGNVSAYTINSSTGALKAIAGSPFAAGNGADWVTVDPSGRFAYVSNYNDVSVSAYTIDSSTGALRAISGSPFAGGNNSLSVTVDPSGSFVYVTNQCRSFSDCSTGTVSAYTINSSTGALRTVAGSPFAAGNFPASLAVDPSGRFVYVANGGDDTIAAYTINRSTGALKAIAGSPFAAGLGPVSVTVDPLGRFAYVANDTGNNVSAYTINSSTGALRAVAGSPFAAGNGSFSVAVDPSGRFAYVVNNRVGNVSAYTINSSTGALHAVAGSPFETGSGSGSGPQSVAIAGQAVSTSMLTLSPRSLDFGNLPIHTSSAAQSVTVTNTSAKTVAITGIALRGTAPGQFSFTSDCGKSLAAYRTCALEAVFKPTTKGAKTAFLDVNGGGGGRSVKLTGTGT